MSNDSFWREPRTRRQVAENILDGLDLKVATEPEAIEARKKREAEERMKRHDAHFAEDFVAIRGAERPISKTLATQLGYSLRQPRFTAASEPDDGEVADDYRADGQ